MQKRKLLTAIFLCITLFLLLTYFIRNSGHSLNELTPNVILHIAKDHVIIVLLFMLLLMTLQNLFTFIPLIFVISLNIKLFGFWRGYLYSTFSSVVGSTSIFLTVRYFFSGLFTSPKLHKFDEKLEKNGFKFVLSGRILPFLPTNLINIASGLSKIRLTHFISATTIGNLIYGLVLASVAYGFFTISKGHKILFYSTILLIVFFIFYMKWHKRKRISD